MDIFYEALFAIAFILQILGVSVYGPRRVVRRAQGRSSAGPDETRPHLGSIFQTYSTLNNLIAAAGLAVLVLCLTLQFRGLLTAQLFCIGLFFLIQIAPIAVLFRRGVLPLQQSDTTEDALPPDSSPETYRLFSILSPIPVGIALLLYLSFLIVMVFQWDQFESDPLPKIAVLTVTNLIFATTILWNYYKLKNASAEQAGEGYQELTRMAPVIIFGSILVTIYFFIKEIMFGLDLHELRPTMMSIFLLLIAIAIFQTLSREEPTLPGRH